MEKFVYSLCKTCKFNPWNGIVSDSPLWLDARARGNITETASVSQEIKSMTLRFLGFVKEMVICAHYRLKTSQQYFVVGFFFFPLKMFFETGYTSVRRLIGRRPQKQGRKRKHAGSLPKSVHWAYSCNKYCTVCGHPRNAQALMGDGVPNNGCEESSYLPSHCKC